MSEYVHACVRALVAGGQECKKVCDNGILRALVDYGTIPTKMSENLPVFENPHKPTWQTSFV